MPAYPTKLDVLAEPELLARYVPPAWLAKAEVAGALSAFLAVNAAGCADKAKSSQPHVDPRLANAAIVAPVFEHGDGRGATGCIVVSPPVFLSEEEALQIIEEELTHAGLELSARNVDLPDVVIPRRSEDLVWDAVKGEWRWRLVELSDTGTPLRTNFQDAKRRVALTYVDHVSYCALGGPASFSTVDGYNLKEVAHFVADKLSASGTGGYFGVFYDPLVEFAPVVDWVAAVDGKRIRMSWEEEKEHALRESKRLLREQVKDFADWLKGQGVI